MPFTKQQNRQIYITAIVLSFILIAGSIYLHIRQKHHLGRLSYNRHINIVQPTEGVESTTEKEEPANLNSALIGQEIDYNYSSEEFGKMDEEDVPSSKPKISEQCYECLCMTVNECQTTFCSPDKPCGLYRISKFYWIDGGQNKIDIDEYDAEESADDRENRQYLSCVNDKSCSDATILQYVNRYERDCNKDGTIDCRDYIALHLLGPNGCMTQNMSFTHARRMQKCLGL